MTGKTDDDGMNRRKFLKGVVASAPVAAATLAAGAQSSDSAGNQSGAVAAPSGHAEAMERAAPEGYTQEQIRRYFIEHPGSDVMVDALKYLDIDYVASNPGSTFRGLQESIVTYGGNYQPEFLTCLHEESSVAMAHGYAKIAGKPMAVACHGTVGLQHASMALYNAWCDRVPVVVLAGNHLDATHRAHQVTWAHSVQDTALIVRDFIKWDDTPVSLQHFLESLVRSYKIATTPPMGPVVLTADAQLQESSVGQHSPAIPRLSPTVPPLGDAAALDEAARLLVEAKHPLILADRVARTPVGVARLVALAEALQAPLIDRLGRMNFPNDHYLFQLSRRRELIAQADVILGLEMTDMWGSMHRLLDLAQQEQQNLARPDVKLITLGVGDLYLKSNYQNFSRYTPVDMSIAGDAEASLPLLTEAVTRRSSTARASRRTERAEALRRAYRQMRDRDARAAKYAWNASPVTTARLCMELWQQIRGRDWSLLSDPIFQSYWPQRLWTFDKHHQYIGGSGGYGVGYGAPAAVGAALANREHGRLSVNIQADGDLMYAPGVLWTAAHHRIPLLSIMHNNRAYHQETMHLQRMALRRRRGVDGNANTGTTIDRPAIDFAQLAKSMGVWSAGPISDPAQLAPAIQQAIRVVDSGEPALIDVVCQPR